MEQRSKIRKWKMSGDVFNETHKKLLDKYQSRPDGQDIYDALQKYEEVPVILMVSNMTNISEAVLIVVVSACCLITCYCMHGDIDESSHDRVAAEFGHISVIIIKPNFCQDRGLTRIST